ncbi:MAG: 50S ribosomal protein L10 [Chloroflexi bacterium]|nr:50S ribosomal protein L10 [Chloroflexota bacterium]
MALSREEKERLINEHDEKLARAQVLIWSRYTGLGVGQMTAFRRQIQATGAELVVVKNSLFQRALDARGLPYDPEVMTGPNLVAFAYDNIAGTTKAINDFSRTSNERLAITGGLVGGRLASVAQVQSLADLPSREVLLARVLGGVQAPVAGLVGTLSAMVRGVMNVLNARAQQLEGSDA